MKKSVWVSPNVTSWWRLHPPWSTKDDIIKISNRQWAIKRAREIANNQEYELELQRKNWFLSTKNSYWRDPFPPFHWK